MTCSICRIDTDRTDLNRTLMSNVTANTDEELKQDSSIDGTQMLLTLIDLIWRQPKTCKCDKVTN